MIPAYINVAILLPGLYMEDGKPPHTDNNEIYSSAGHGDGYAFLENEARAIYSVDRNKTLKYFDETKVKENGYLDETLLVFRGLRVLQSECSPPQYNGNWLEEYIDSISYEENMLAIYNHVRADYNELLFNSQVVPYCQDGWTKHIGPKKEFWHDEKIIDFSFIACFQVHTSQGYEDLYPEIDCIEFLGEGKVTL